jgi:hypothetical protein
LIALFGKVIIRRLHIISNSDGLFKKILGIIILITGISIIIGFDKTIETTIIDSGWYGVTRFEENLIQKLQ